MDKSRRDFLKNAGIAASLACLPQFALAAGSLKDPRLLVILLRGGLDGLHAVQAPGDPAYKGLRGRLLAVDKAGAALKLDSTFALHPSLAFAHRLYGEGQFAPVVAIAPPYRQRSHFDAQDCLENGTARPGARSGWMNRMVAALPGTEGLALASMMPLIMRGNGDTTTWSPPMAEGVDPVLLQRLETLYAADPALSASFAKAVNGELGADVEGGFGRRGRLVQMGKAAAQFMSAANGPRIGFIEDSGWDTHGNQVAILSGKLKELDLALQSFHAAAQPIWRNTVIVVVTEFGRTAAVNGTLGTDHGTGGSAFLAGGAVLGGRVQGDWPGLAPSQLNEGRDLRATADMRGLFKGVLQAHLGLSPQVCDRQVFPESAGVGPMGDLLRQA